MTTIAFDTETWPIQPGLQAPRLVCGAFADARDGSADLCNAADTVKRLRRHLLAGDTIVTHNGAYDAGVMVAFDPTLLDPIMAHMEAGLWRDTMIAQRLDDLANGVLDTRRYSLASLVQLHLNKDISKDKTGHDIWRLRYCELDGLPVEAYPAEAKRYALSDAIYTLRVYQKQTALHPDEERQVRTAFALQLGTIWGMRVDAGAVAKLKHRLACDLASIDSELQALGILRENGSKNMDKVRELVSDAYGGKPPTTDNGNVRTDGDTLAAVADKHRGLALLAERGQPAYFLKSTIPMLETGGNNFCPRFFVVKATGRVSSRPNAQNLPREGGFRECFVARPGTVIVMCDYSQMEIRTFAQVLFDLFGENELQRDLVAGTDVHRKFACAMLGIGYDEYDEDEHGADRQFAKIPNFGLPGGMGANSFRQYAAQFGYDVDQERAEEVVRLWREHNPTAQRYFAHISRKRDALGYITVTQHRSGRVRAGAYFTEACNTLFQGLAADAMFDACWRVVRECYTDPTSALYGCRLLVSIHDEILLEAPEDVDKASAAALRLRDVMQAAGERWCPNVPVVAGPVIARRWYKNAKPVWDEQRRLREWKPNETPCCTASTS